MLVNSLILSFVITFCHASPTSSRHHRREIRKNGPIALAQTDLQNIRTPPSPFTYGLWNTEGKACAFALLDARVYVDYQSTKGQRRTSIRTHPDAHVRGHCRSLLNPGTELDIHSPPGMTTRFHFKLNADETNFEVAEIKLVYRLSDSLFHDSISNESRLAEASPESIRAFQNSLNRRSCPGDIKFITKEGGPQNVKIKFNAVRFEVFGIHTGINTTLESPNNCAPEVKTNAAASINKQGTIFGNIFVTLIVLIFTCFYH